MNSKQWFNLTLTVCLVDCLLPFLLALFYPGYNHLTMAVSALGNEASPPRYFFDIWMLILGGSFVAIGFHLYHQYSASPKWIRVTFLAVTVIYAVCDCIVSGFFASGESSKMKTIPQMIHGYGSAIGCTVLVFSGLLAAGLLRSTNARLSKYMLLDFLCAFLTFGLFIASDKAQDADGVMKVISYTGLWQRISFLFMYIPYVVLAR